MPKNASTDVTHGPEWGNPERRIIWIPAVPASGTSCAAGILRELGVDMGKTNPPSWMIARGYPMWEDPDMALFGALWNDKGMKLEVVSQRHVRLREYINYRFIQNPGHRCGFKAPAHFWADDPEPEKLPVELLDVHRPLEDSIQADWRTNQTRCERRPDLPPPSEEEARLRAGSLAMCMMAKMQLFKKIEPTYRMMFYELLENPKPFVDDLIDAFRLEPTPDQVKAAIESVNPRMRHV
jgi:hypothetical protein